MEFGPICRTIRSYSDNKIRDKIKNPDLKINLHKGLSQLTSIILKQNS